jgi:hypothetical protein
MLRVTLRVALTCPIHFGEHLEDEQVLSQIVPFLEHHQHGAAVAVLVLETQP